MAVPYESSVKYQEDKKKYLKSTNPFDLFSATGKAQFTEAMEVGAGKYTEAQRGDRSEEYATKYDPTIADWKTASNQEYLDQLALAKRQAQMKLGFAQSSGPGTAGAWGAADLALERQFAVQKAAGLNEIDKYAAQFRLNWDLQQDKYDYGEDMARANFQYQQLILQQQAELNSDSWWDTAGQIVGTVAGMALTIKTGGAAAPLVYA